MTNYDPRELPIEDRLLSMECVLNPEFERMLKSNPQSKKYMEDGFFCLAKHTYYQDLEETHPLEASSTEEEQQRRWTANQELRQQIQYREIVQQVQYNRQINQLLDFQSRPNPFK